MVSLAADRRVADVFDASVWALMPAVVFGVFWLARIVARAMIRLCAEGVRVGFMMGATPVDDGM